jgi:hypothetical protein
MYFSHPSLVIYLFAIPPIKLNQQIGGGLLIAKHLDQIIMMGQSETLTSTQIVFITLFSAGARRCWAIHQPPQREHIC